MNRPVRVLTGGLFAVTGALALGSTGSGASLDLSAADGLTRFVDDTGTIAVSVPEAWTVDTAAEFRSGVAFPRVGAHRGDYSMSVTVTAQVYVNDLETTVCGAWYVQGGCEHYNDDNLAGYVTRSEE